MNRDELIIYLSKVAHFMGGWRVDSRNQHRLFLLGDEGVRIFVGDASHRQSDRGKIFLSGCFPTGYSARLDSPRIGVSYSRSPESVAKDIKKRLLPDFFKELEKVKKHLEDKEAQRKRMEDVVNLLRGVELGTLHERYNSDVYYRRIFSSKFNDIGLETVISRGDSDIKITNLSHDQMIKLAYFIKNM